MFKFVRWLNMKKILIGAVLLCVLACLLYIANLSIIGAGIDAHNGVVVHYNGWNIAQSHGKHFAIDGYYYGRKWQCVEFVKRYYHDHLKHDMPDGWGNAKDFFDAGLPHGAFNKRRGLYQYYNDGKETPKPDDLLVYHTGKYGHVAIVTEV